MGSIGDPLLFGLVADHPLYGQAGSPGDTEGTWIPCPLFPLPNEYHGVSGPSPGSSLHLCPPWNVPQAPQVWCAPT